jgi:hypothetical protein
MLGIDHPLRSAADLFATPQCQIVTCPVAKFAATRIYSLIGSEEGPGYTGIATQADVDGLAMKIVAGNQLT